MPAYGAAYLRLEGIADPLLEAIIVDFFGFHVRYNGALVAC